MSRVSRLACLAGLLGISLACFAGAAAPAAHATPKPTGAVQAIRGWVLLSAFKPVRGARVTLETVTGKPIATLDKDALQITNKSGAFSLRATVLPKRFVVVARGGKAAGRSMTAPLRAKVFGLHPLDLVRVNVLTTITATRQTRHPREPYNTSVAKVRRLLSIPSWHTVDRDASASSEYFDGVRFATYAQAHGGMTAFLGRLQRELESAHPAARDFHGSRRTVTHSRALAGTARSSDDDSAAGFIFGSLAKGILGGIGNDLFGSILKQVGLTGDPTAAVTGQLGTIENDLNTISAQLTELKGAQDRDFAALSSQVAQTAYNNAAGNLTTYEDAINTATGNLLYFVKNPTDPGNPGKAQKTLASIENNLAPFATAFNAAMTPGAPGTKDLLTLAQQNFYAGAKLNQPLIGGTGLSKQANDVYQYYASYEAQLVELLVEADNAGNETSNYITQQDIQPATGVPATATTAATPGYLDNWQAEILPPVPPYVFADLRTGRIWSILNAAATDCSDSLNSLGGMWTAANVGLNAPDPATPVTCTFPVDGYSLPTIADLLALTAGWKDPIAQPPPPAAPVPQPPDVLAWLTAMTGPTGMPTYIGTVQPAVNYENGPFGRAGSNGTPWAFWADATGCTYDANEYDFISGALAGSFTQCQILDLATGTATTECVADRESIGDGGSGCETPEYGGYYTGPIALYPCAPCGSISGIPISNGYQLDYFHPNLVLGWRMPNPGEQYWAAP